MKLSNPDELKYFFYITTKSDIAQKIPLQTGLLLLLLVGCAALLICAGCCKYEEVDTKSFNSCQKTHEHFTKINQEMEAMHR